MFTERYMVDWLLQNSLGPMWLAMCPAERLDRRGPKPTARWRSSRPAASPGARSASAARSSLTELMPLHSEAERRWAYYVPAALPEDAVEHAPESIRELKLLDPAVGSGHFLVVAFDLLVALYREEARHRGEEGQLHWTTARSSSGSSSHNLHGIDLDPRAVQIAAAALWLKARQTWPEAQPRA
jgi:hypothetical protein